MPLAPASPSNGNKSLSFFLFHLLTPPFLLCYLSFFVSLHSLENSTEQGIEVAGGREKLVLTGLDGLEDPPSLVELRTLTCRNCCSR